DVAEKILETPLVSSVREDKVVWDEERNECYSVKSGYKLAMRYLIGSDKYHVMGNWNGIWKAQAPHKARHLLWRLCRGCLPTRSRLLERRVECILNCPVCDEEFEDKLHIFFRCAVAQDSWSAAGLSSVLHNAMYQQTNAMDRIFAICSNESSDTIGRVAMLLWCIWQNRNDKLWNDNVQMPRQIGRHAFDAWNDWYSVHKLQSNNVSGTTEVDLVRWEKPALDWVKCNVDVAFVAGSGRTSMGLCFRDNSGHFIAGMTQWQQTVISSVEGEAWALLLAMEEARHRGLNRVQFESDSKVLVEAIHMKRRGNSEFLSIVHDILSLMSSFINFEVKFLRRQANLVAHTLARAANSWASFHRMGGSWDRGYLAHAAVSRPEWKTRPSGSRPYGRIGLDSRLYELIDQADDFSEFPEDLRSNSWRLTNAELKFLERVMFLKDGLIEDGYFIENAEDEHHLRHELVFDLFDKTWHLKESMRVHEELMNLAFTEEEAVTHRMKVLEEELKMLAKKNEELCVSNKDEISALLFKRRELARLEIKTKTLGESLKKINDDLTTSKKYKRALEDMQTMAIDAIPDV
ncbi:hypothetical protein TSUD_404450, partial [Trifolium subterraneum]